MTAESTASRCQDYGLQYLVAIDSHLLQDLEGVIIAMMGHVRPPFLLENYFFSRTHALCSRHLPDAGPRSLERNQHWFRNGLLNRTQGVPLIIINGNLTRRLGAANSITPNCRPKLSTYRGEVARTQQLVLHLKAGCPRRPGSGKFMFCNQSITTQSIVNHHSSCPTWVKLPFSTEKPTSFAP